MVTLWCQMMSWIITVWRWLFAWGSGGPLCCPEVACAASTGGKEGVFVWGRCIYVHWYIYKYSNGAKSHTLDHLIIILKLFCAYPPETGSLTSPSKYGLEMEGGDALHRSHFNPALLNSSWQRLSCSDLLLWERFGQIALGTAPR